jgi:hypothetical protein
MNLTSYEKGGLSAARNIFLALLVRRFGPVPAAMLNRVNQLSFDKIQELVNAFVDGQSLEEMGLRDDESA